jgi:hypothetical protein
LIWQQAHATGVKRSHTNNGVQQQLMQMPRTAPMNLKTALLQQNRQLQKEVGVLENEVQTMSSKMQGISGSRRRARQPQLRGVKVFLSSLPRGDFSLCVCACVYVIVLNSVEV